MITGLKTYREFSRLKKTALVAVAMGMADKDVNLIKIAFEELDQKKNGTISLDEFRTVMRKVCAMQKQQSMYSSVLVFFGCLIPLKIYLSTVKTYIYIYLNFFFHGLIFFSLFFFCDSHDFTQLSHHFTLNFTHNFHTTFTQHLHNLHTTFTQLLHTTFTQLSHITFTHNFHTTFTQLSHNFITHNFIYTQQRQNLLQKQKLKIYLKMLI